ncbi:MAG TPA: preprotein translocase subunit SecY [Candidatus Paceibacterota bacterium]
MIGEFFSRLKLVATDHELRRKVLFIFFILAVFRALAAIPVPGVDASRLAAFFADSQLLSIFNLFSGGGLSAFSLVALGVGPYITASIILQLATMMFPRLKEMYHEEGQSGRRRFAQYARVATVPIAALQAVGIIKLLESQQVLPALSGSALAITVVAMVAGSVFLMWLGELISEFGIGNGVSIIIFAGIVAGLPQAVTQLQLAYDPSQLPSYLVFGALAIATVLGVVAVTEAERPIPVAHARQVIGGRSAGPTYVPIRLNQAGVMPIIFALSIMLVPRLLASAFAASSHGWLVTISDWSRALTENQWLYGVFYFLLVVAFTFFYTAVTFEPDTMAKNLQRSGAFVPGVRPGEATAEHIGKIVARTTAVGAVFLGLVAILPLVASGATGVQQVYLGGTGLLIVVNVVTDAIKRLDGQITMRQY